MCMSNHRKPPKPAHWGIPRGNCRFCGHEIIENGKRNNRKHWHEQCAHTWNIMNNPAYASRYVHKRDQYTCRECGIQDRNGSFDVDHIKPLFEANGNPLYWQSPNLRLLCKECHKDKTRSDMIRYRASKKKLN